MFAAKYNNPECLQYAVDNGCIVTQHAYAYAEDHAYYGNDECKKILKKVKTDIKKKEGSEV